MPAIFTRTKSWVSNEVLTASDLNAEFNNLLNNTIPASIDDYSADVATMQSGADPGGVGTESLATSLAGEIQRLRFAIKRIVGGDQWYSTPSFDLTTASLTASNIASDAVTTVKILDDNVTIAKLANSARQIQKEVFTSSGTFTTPATASTDTVYKVTCVGSGGGGGMWNNAPGGGGAGGTSIKYVSGLAASFGVTVTIGAGGAGASSNATSGSAGAATSFGAHCVANGGAGGFSNGTYGDGGAGGVVAGAAGDIIIPGGNGSVNAPAVTLGGFGGSSMFGAGGLGANVSASRNGGNAGIGYGSGGGGGWTAAGGAGAGGLCIVEWVL